MEQKKDRKQIRAELDAAGFENTWAWVLGFLFIALVLVGIGFHIRYKDLSKNEGYSYVDASLIEVDKQNTYMWRKWRRRTTTTYIKVAYKPEGSDKYYEIGKNDVEPRIVNKPYRVFYKEDDPKDAYITMCDWLTGEYLPVEKDYDLPIALAGFATIIALYLFFDEQRARHKIKKGTFKVRKRAKGEPEYDPNLHQLARMSGYKRSWAGAWFGFGMLYLLFMTMGVSWVTVSLTDPKSRDFLIPGIIVICIAQGAPMAIFLTARYLTIRKNRFIKAFMEDEITEVYADRKKAARTLWKHVKHYMEAEPPRSKYKLQYERYWVEIYADYLEKYKQPKA